MVDHFSRGFAVSPWEKKHTFFWALGVFDFPSIVSQSIVYQVYPNDIPKVN
jgi:hypothetical protein